MGSASDALALQENRPFRKAQGQIRQDLMKSLREWINSSKPLLEEPYSACDRTRKITFSPPF